MSSLIRGALGATLMALSAGAQHLPAGFQPALSGTRHEIAGYSVRVPGKGWVEGKHAEGVIFGKRIDHTESYHAGLAVTPTRAIKSKAEFSALAKELVGGQPSNPRYNVVRNEHTESERDGLWLIQGRMDFEDSGAVNVGRHGTLATHNAHLLAMDPREPGQMIRLWFSWRTVEFDDAKFTAEADRFFATFQRTGQRGAAPTR